MHKKYVYILTLLTLIAACQSDKPVEQQSQSAVKTETRPSAIKNADKTLDVPWIAVYNDSTQLLEMKKNPVGNVANLNQQDIIDALNLKYPEIKLEAVSIANKKLVLNIADATHLTRELGSAGARSYLAEATYSLTEIKGINAIDFRFAQGDHASPGIFTRKSFENFN